MKKDKTELKWFTLFTHSRSAFMWSHAVKGSTISTIKLCFVHRHNLSLTEPGLTARPPASVGGEPVTALLWPGKFGLFP